MIQVNHLLRRCSSTVSHFSRNTVPGSTVRPSGTQCLKAVSFSGCGWLVGFHLGAAGRLMHHGLLTASTPMLAGVSGGALVAGALATGVPLATLHRLYEEEGQAMLRSGGWRKGQLADMLRRLAHRLVPDNAVQLARGRLLVAVARPQLAMPPRKGLIKLGLVSDFADKDDLIEVGSFWWSQDVGWQFRESLVLLSSRCAGCASLLSFAVNVSPLVNPRINTPLPFPAVSCAPPRQLWLRATFRTTWTVVQRPRLGANRRWTAVSWSWWLACRVRSMSRPSPGG